MQLEVTFYALGPVIMVNNSEPTFSCNYVHAFFLKQKKARLYLGKDSQVYLVIYFATIGERVQ